MEMDDNKLKRLLQEGMEWEADCIMAEVNSDPNVKDLVAPEEIHDKLMQQIREHEQEKEKERENQAKEEEELIRLGKLYKKKRARRKYIVLIAAVMCALGVGTISFGDGKKVFTEVKRLLSDREQAVVNSGDAERHIDRGDVSEEDAYEQINEKFGFWPVRMYYLPDEMQFVEAVTEEDAQNIRIYYEKGTDSMISCTIWPNYRTASIGADVEDTVIQEYNKEIAGTIITIKQYIIEDSEDARWRAEFVYNDVQYFLLMTGIVQEEVEKIVENLYFS